MGSTMIALGMKGLVRCWRHIQQTSVAPSPLTALSADLFRLTRNGIQGLYSGDQTVFAGSEEPYGTVRAAAHERREFAL